MSASATLPSPVSAKAALARPSTPAPPPSINRTLTYRRLAKPAVLVALILLMVSQVAQAIAAVAAGQLAAAPTWNMLWLFAALMLSNNLIHTLGEVIWSRQVNYATGQLRADLLDAALAQPVPIITAQAAGEVLDRVDDDTNSVSNLMRGTMWWTGRTLFAAISMWVAAGLMWWPSWALLPVMAAAVFFLTRKQLKEIARLKVVEEEAWTAHAAAFEEAVSARDDIRTSGGQAFATRRLAELSAVVHRRVRAVAGVEFTMLARSGVALYALLAAVGVATILLTLAGHLSLAQLVTVFIAAGAMVSAVTDMSEFMPQIQEGVGAITRIKTLLGVAPEPAGGLPVPPGAVAIEFRDLTFSYNDDDGAADSKVVEAGSQSQGLETTNAAEAKIAGRARNDNISNARDDNWVVEAGSESQGLETTNETTKRAAFALTDVNLVIPAGQTMALVGRTGSGKSTLASLLSRAVEPPPGTVLIGGRDIDTIDLDALRTAVGVVTQRTELLAGTLQQNITLFAPTPPGAVEHAIAPLGLTGWVADLPKGLDTLLGPGGTKLSAGEEQLVAFARLLVRDVQVVVLDEATARMDPLTEARVVQAAGKLLAGRTGVVVAHRLGTIERAEHIAVLDHGVVVQTGDRAELAAVPGPYRDLLNAAHRDHAQVVEDSSQTNELETTATTTATNRMVEDSPQANGLETTATTAVVPKNEQIGTARRKGAATGRREPRTGMGVLQAAFRMVGAHPRWGLFGAALFTLTGMAVVAGPIVGWFWGHLVEQTAAGAVSMAMLVAFVGVLLVSRLLLAWGVMIYPLWWIQLLLRIRMAVMRGQTAMRRLPATPPGEVTSRAMDADRFVYYADQWIDVLAGVAQAVVTAVLARSWIAGGMLLVIMVSAAASAMLGRSIAGRAAAEAAATRATFGRQLVSSLDAIRTVKLSARVPAIRAHLREVDSGRVKAAIFEQQVGLLLMGIPILLCFAVAVAAWWLHLAGQWDLATALMVSSTAIGFIYYGIVSGGVVRNAPGVQAWQKATQQFADGANLVAVPPGVSLVTGAAPAPLADSRTGLSRLELRDVTVRFDDDGTIGVSDVSFSVSQGQIVLLLGQVGSGKSSLLAALAGLRTYDGDIVWDGSVVSEPEEFLRPGRVAYVSQLPKVVSGTFAENIALDHAERSLDLPVSIAGLGVDIEVAGGLGAKVGHRGVKLSGGQAQRLALARAVAVDADLLVADDISSALDAATELHVWRALREHGQTVVGSTSKAAALALADQVVVFDAGRQVATGTWAELAPRYHHLAG